MIYNFIIILLLKIKLIYQQEIEQKILAVFRKKLFSKRVGFLNILHKVQIVALIVLLGTYKL